jgi:effector-binding domain-containing protein
MRPAIKIVEVKEQPMLSVREAADMPSIAEKMGRIFLETFTFMQKQGIVPSGPPFSYYHDVFSEATSKGVFDMECGFPVSEPAEGEGHIKAGKLPGGKTLKAVHIGPYQTLSETYEAVMAWAKEMGIQLGDNMWEIYLTDPDKEKDSSKWVTEILWPIK